MEWEFLWLINIYKLNPWILHVVSSRSGPHLEREAILYLPESFNSSFSVQSTWRIWKRGRQQKKVCNFRVSFRQLRSKQVCSVERDSLLRDPIEGTSRFQTEPLNTYAQEPLTSLTKTLLILALVLLLTSSVCLQTCRSGAWLNRLYVYKIFIGLFVGAHHRLSLDRDGKPRTTVISATTTSTVTSAITTTATSAFTTTVISTSIGTTTFIPLPVPTKAPEKVCVTCSHDIRQHD